MSFKRYLATYTVVDGEHEHSGHLLIIASSEDEAWSFAHSFTHDFDRWDDEYDNQHPWSYGDGGTASKLHSVREVSEEQFDFVKEAMGLLVCERAEVSDRSGLVT